VIPYRRSHLYVPASVLKLHLSLLNIKVLSTV